MLKIKKKIKFTHSENRMQQEGDVRLSINSFDKNKNKNLFALLKERFDWMNDFIQENDKGIEVGAAAGFSKLFIKNNDVPGVIGKIGTILGKMGINISGYLLSKVEDKDFAYSIIRIDNKIPNKTIPILLEIEDLIDIKQLYL